MVVDPLCAYLGVALIEELLEQGVAVATIFPTTWRRGWPPPTASAAPGTARAPH